MLRWQILIAMLHFTAHKDDRIDACIDSHLERIALEYCRRLPEPEALVLVGGFSRGEGSVIREGSNIQPLNPFDIVAVSPGADTVEDVRTLESALARAAGVTGVDLFYMESRSLRRLKSTLFNYDMKAKGHVFFGSPKALSRIPRLKVRRMPVGEGRSLLFAHMFRLLESYIEPEGRARAKVGAMDLAAYQAAKTIAACGTTRLLLRREYHPGYRERCRRFRALFPDEEETGTLLDKATRYKLFPGEAYPFDVWDLWIQARSLLVETFRDYYETISEKTFPRWVDLCKRHRKATLGRIRLLAHGFRGPREQYRSNRYLELAGLGLIGCLPGGEEPPGGENDELLQMAGAWLGRVTGEEYGTDDIAKLRRECVSTFNRLRGRTEREIEEPPCIVTPEGTEKK